MSASPPKGPPVETSSKYRIKSLDKALTILELIVSEGRELSITEISQRLGMGKGSVHRFLSTLKSHKFVQQDAASKEYSVGVRALELASSVQKEPLLRKVMLPILKKLSIQCKEATNAGLLDYDEIVYLIHIESEESLRFSISVGTRWPAYCTAMGKILLAALDDALLREMFASRGELRMLTDKPPITFDQLMDTLREVRQSGLAYDHEEAVLGVSCLAAPVRSFKGQVVSAISVSGPTVRMQGQRWAELTEMLLAAAAEISQEL